ncbi:hypothetical protein RA265_27940, partial [Pseudomonas syringae pv. tagetis]
GVFVVWLLFFFLCLVVGFLFGVLFFLLVFGSFWCACCGCVCVCVWCWGGVLGCVFLFCWGVVWFLVVLFLWFLGGVWVFCGLVRLLWVLCGLVLGEVLLVLLWVYPTLGRRGFLGGLVMGSGRILS